MDGIRLESHDSWCILCIKCVRFVFILQSKWIHNVALGTCKSNLLQKKSSFWNSWFIPMTHKTDWLTVNFLCPFAQLYSVQCPVFSAVCRVTPHLNCIIITTIKYCQCQFKMQLRLFDVQYTNYFGCLDCLGCHCDIKRRYHHFSISPPHSFVCVNWIISWKLNWMRKQKWMSINFTYFNFLFCFILL